MPDEVSEGDRPPPRQKKDHTPEQPLVEPIRGSAEIHPEVSPRAPTPGEQKPVPTSAEIPSKAPCAPTPGQQFATEHFRKSSETPLKAKQPAIRVSEGPVGPATQQAAQARQLTERLEAHASTQGPRFAELFRLSPTADSNFASWWRQHITPERQIVLMNSLAGEGKMDARIEGMFLHAFSQGWVVLQEPFAKFALLQTKG